jgi:hypothetical protein
MITSITGIRVVVFEGSTVQVRGAHYVRLRRLLELQQLQGRSAQVEKVAQAAMVSP